MMKAVPEKAVAVALWQRGGSAEGEMSLAELHNLARAAGVQVVRSFTQIRPQADKRYYIGPGKAQEIGAYAEENNIATVIFDSELSPSQVNNLERLIPAKIIDRSELILDIFAQRATSKEGKLQVELAQLKYQLPKLMGKGRDLSRLAGGIGTRGPGETKLEMDRRRIRQRIDLLERQIRRLERHRSLLRKQREKRDVFQAALVGYTNSGKSTLLNQLTGADALAADALFVTLDPLARKMPAARIPIVISDTVGFISGLPHHLIAAFKATLEEVSAADLLLHVIDASDPNVERQVQEVDKVLAQLGCADKERIIVANKIDLVAPQAVQNLANKFRGMTMVPVSALHGANIDKLAEEIQRHMEPMVRFRALLPRKIFGRLNAAYAGNLIPLEFGEDYVRVEGELPGSVAATLAKYYVKE